MHSLIALLEKVVRTHLAKQKLGLLAPVEHKLERALGEAFLKQGKMFLSRLRRSQDEWPVVEATTPSWEPAFNEAIGETLEAFEQPLNEAVTNALRAGSRASLSTVGMEMAFDLANPLAEAYILEHGAKLVSGINDVSKSQIQTIISKAMEEGWSYNDTAKALTDKFKQFAVGNPIGHIDSRAHLIAVTEASQAYETAARVGVQELVDAGLEMEKAWIETGGACSVCQANADMGWIPYDDTFSNGEATVADSHPGCRCATEYRRAGTGEVTS